MLIKVCPSSVTRGRKALLLCDDAGEPLPMQFASELTQKIGDGTIFTVSFKVDGERLRFEG